MENSRHRGACWATVHRVAESDMTEQLTNTQYESLGMSHVMKFCKRYFSTINNTTIRVCPTFPVIFCRGWFQPSLTNMVTASLHTILRAFYHIFGVLQFVFTVQ